MTKPALRIAVSSAAGDPRLEKTWSGTPFNLITALEEQDTEVLPIDSSLSRPQRAFSKLAQRLVGYTGDTARGPVARRIAARRVESRCIQAGIRTVLHTGSLDLPGTAQGRALHRFVYCDYTWDLRARYAAGSCNFPQRSIQITDRLERLAFAAAKGVFPISHYVKENLAAHYGVNSETITVVGTGRGKIAPFYGAKDYAAGPILFVAKDRFEEKGGTLLLDGFRLASKTNPSLKLVLAGKGVEGMTANTQDLPNVVVAGHVSWEQLERLFGTAALFAMPAYCEPWGIVYLEALACRTPLLGLARNSIPELTGNGRFGVLVDKPEPRLVAEAILRATANPKKLEQMGAEGQEYCLKTFSWAQTAAAILNRITTHGT